MDYVFVKYLHILAVLVLFSTLVLEHLFTKAGLDADARTRLARIDMIYGIAAGVVLIAGLLMWFAVGKDAEFYSYNPVFYAKVGLFVLVGLISIYPTVFFIRHRQSTDATIAVPRSVIMAIRVELLLMLIIPLLAVAMAQGYGL